MIIWEPFDRRLEHSESTLMLEEAVYEAGTGTPNTTRVDVDSCEDIEQVLDIYAL